MITILRKVKDKNAQTSVLKLKDADVSEQGITKALASDVKDQNIFEARIVETSQLYDPNTDKVYLIADAVSDILGKLSKNSFNLDILKAGGIAYAEELQKVATDKRLLAGLARLFYYGLLQKDFDINIDANAAKEEK